MAALAIASVVAVGPAFDALEERVVTARNPLYRGGGGGGGRASPIRERSRCSRRRLRADPEDRDLAYLLGSAWRRSGRVGDAAALYRRLLGSDPSDTVARNNLANIEFAGG